jgi:hypothetical protein
MPRRPPDPLVYYLDANLDGPELVLRLRIVKRPPPMIIYLSPDGQLQTHLGGERRGGRKKA